MNEQYLQGYFDTYVKPSRPDTNYQDWLLKIKDNDSYKRGMFDSNVKAAKPDATYEDWNSKVFGTASTPAQLETNSFQQVSEALSSPSTSPMEGFGKAVVRGLYDAGRTVFSRTVDTAPQSLAQFGEFAKTSIDTPASVEEFVRTRKPVDFQEYVREKENIPWYSGFGEKGFQTYLPKYAEQFMREKGYADVIPRIKANKENVINRRLGVEEYVQQQKRESDYKLAGATKGLQDIKSPSDVASLIGSFGGEAIYQIPIAALSRGSSSFVQEAATIYDMQLDNLAKSNGISREEVIKRNLDNPAAGQAYALLAAGLDAASAGKAVSALKSKGGAAVKEWLKSAGTEAVTEPAQGIAETLGAGRGSNETIGESLEKAVLTEEGLLARANEAVGGFIGAGVVKSASNRFGANIDQEINETTSTGDPEIDAEIDAVTNDVASAVANAPTTNVTPQSNNQDTNVRLQPDNSESNIRVEPDVQETQAFTESEQPVKSEQVDPIQEAVGFTEFLTGSGKETSEQLADYLQGKFKKRSQFEQFVETFNETNDRKITPKEADKAWEAVRPKRQEELFAPQVKQLSEIEDIAQFKQAAISLIDKTNLNDEQRNTLKAAVETKTQNKFITQLQEALGREPMVTMTRTQALKQQIKTLARGVEKGKKFIKESLVPKLKGVNLTPRQRGAILNRLTKTDILFNPQQFDTFVDKVVDDAGYADKLGKAKNIRKKIAKKAGDKKTQTVQDRQAIRNFLAIDYENLGNLDEYIEKAGQITESFKPVLSNANEPSSKKFKPIPQAEINEFVRQSVKGRFETLFPSEANTDISVDTMTKRIKEKEQADKDAARRRDLLQEGYTEEELDMLLGEGTIEKEMADVAKKEKARQNLVEIATESKKELPDEAEGNELALESMKTIDLNLLTPDQLKAYIKSADKIALNEDYGGLGIFISTALAQKNFNTIKNMVVDVLGLDITQKTFASLPLLNKAIFGLSTQAAKFQLGMGIKGVSDARAKSVKAREDYDSIFATFKKKFPKVFSPESTFRRGIYENLITYYANEDVDAQFANNKQVIEQTITNYKNRYDSESAKIVEDLYKPFKDARSIEEVKSIQQRIDPNSKALTEAKVEFFKNRQQEIVNYSNTYFNEDTELLENYSGERKWVKLGTKADADPTDAKAIVDQAYAQVGKPKQVGSAKKRQNAVREDAVVNLDTDEVSREQISDITFKMNAIPYMLAVRENMRRVKDLYKIFGNKDTKESFERAEKTFKTMFDKDNGAYFRYEKGALGRMSDAEMDESSRAVSKILKPLKEFTYALTLSGPSQLVKQSTVLGNVAVQLGRDIGLMPIREYFTSKPSIKKFLEGETVSTRKQSRSIFNTGEMYSAKTLRDFKTSLKGFVESGLPRYFDRRMESWWSGMPFLTSTDATVAEISYLAFYKQHLKKNGIKFKGWETENELRKEQSRQEARAYAKQRVDEMQTVSDPAEQSKYIRNNSAQSQIVKAYLTPYGTFSANAKERLWTSWKALLRPSTNWGQKKESISDIVGTSIEQATFHYASFALKAYVFGLLFNELSQAMGADDESEEEKKRAKQRFADELRTKLILDNTPMILVEPVEKGYIDAVNEIWFHQFNPDNLSREKFSEKVGMPMTRYKSKNDAMSVVTDWMGMYGTPVERGRSLYETIDLAQEGVTGGKPLTEEEKTFAWLVAGIQGLNFALRIPSDVSFTAQRELSRIRRQRRNYEKEPKPTY